MTSPEAAPRLRCADCDYPVRLTHRYPGAKQPARSHPVRIEAEAAAGTATAEQGQPALDESLFRVPFDRDYRLLPDAADTWGVETIDAFYDGVEVGIGVVQERFAARLAGEDSKP